MCKEIPLSRGLVALVSAEDYERVSAYKWSCDTSNGYACRMVQVSRTDGIRRRRKVLLHRFIMDEPRGFDVDHANGIRLDCRRSNLRIATRSQNAANSGPYKNRELKGVYDKGTRFEAMIGVDGRRVQLGSFPTREEAARAYDRASLTFFGEFGYLNYPENRHLYLQANAIQRIDTGVNRQLTLATP